MGQMKFDEIGGLAIPALLSRADDYKPMVLKKEFEAAARRLAMQAYWLSWLESLAVLSPNLAAVRFKTPNRRKGEAIQTPVWTTGHTPTARDAARFEQARKRAVTKLHGKHAPSEDDMMREALGGWSYDHEFTESSRDMVMLAAQGVQLFAYAKSCSEQAQLEAGVALGDPDKSDREDGSVRALKGRRGSTPRL